MGSLPSGKWTTDPPKKTPGWVVRAVEIILIITIIGGTLYSQGLLKIDIRIGLPSVQASPTPTATSQHR